MRAAASVWIAICWIVTLGISYMFGWYKGARSAATVAVEAAQSSFPYILVALVIVALVSAVLAFKARGRFMRPSTT